MDNAVFIGLAILVGCMVINLVLCIVMYDMLGGVENDIKHIYNEIFTIKCRERDIGICLTSIEEALKKHSPNVTPDTPRLNVNHARFDTYTRSVLVRYCDLDQFVDDEAVNDYLTRELCIKLSEEMKPYITIMSTDDIANNGKKFKAFIKIAFDKEERANEF